MRGNNKKTKSDKVMYAEKFNERKEAEIHIVWEEWFWDSIKFGGRFEEAGYLISKPRPKEKILDERESVFPRIDQISDLNGVASCTLAAS